MPVHELAFVAVVAVSGAGIVAEARLPLVPRAAIGWLSGVAAYAMVTVVLVVVGVPTSPLVVAAVTLAGVGASLIVRRRRDLPRAQILAALGLTAGVAASVLGADRILDPVRSSRDSYDYSMIAGLLANGHGRLVEFELLRTRLLGYPALHSSGFGDGEIYVSVISPVSTIAAVAVLAWLIVLLVGRHVDRRRAALVAAGAVLALLTSYHFAYQAFYVNAHVLVGAFVLVALVVPCVSSFDQELARSLVAAASCCAAGIVVLRPEGGLLALLVVAAVLAAQGKVPLAPALPVAVGAMMIVWNLHLLRIGRASDAPGGELLQPAMSVVVGMLLVASPWLLRALGARARWVAPTLELGLWFAFAYFALTDWPTIGSSVSATARNLFVGNGTWGPTVPILLVGFAVAAVVVDRRELAPYVYVGRTFFPLMLVLASIRDAAYRVGTGDSLNRSWMHVLFGVTLVVVAVLVGPIRRAEAPRESDVAASRS